MILQQISPSAGPINGGTYVVIEGTNLGVEENHITNVTIGNGTLCDVTDYQPGRR